MKNNLFDVYIDFEFNSSNEEILNLVCCSLRFKKEGFDSWTIKNFWLFNDNVEKKKLNDYVSTLNNNGAVFVAHNVVSEARSFYSLGHSDPTTFTWFDTFLEYRNLSNRSVELNTGKQLVGGKIKNYRRVDPFSKYKKPNKYASNIEESDKKELKLKHNLPEAIYNFFKVPLVNMEVKDKMRDIILSKNDELILAHKDDIMKYCESDVEVLPMLKNKIMETYENRKINIDEVYTAAKWRGNYAALTAIRESKGYPIDMEKVSALIENVELIMDDCRREINDFFPDIKPFKYNKKLKRFTLNQEIVKLWAIKTHGDKWEKTDTLEPSLSLESFEKFYPYRHDYPTDIFGAQMVRYLKLKQHLRGFEKPSDPSKEWFMSSVGSDDRVRPYMNIFGSQTGRSQPSSKAFVMLKPAFLRTVVQPKPGKWLVSCDWASQEYLISALNANDKNMIEAYASGDVYLAYAKQLGIVPKDGTKEQYKTERDSQKPVILGLSFLRSKYGMADSLSVTWNREVSLEEAQREIDKFYKIAADLKKFQDRVQLDYARNKKIRTPDHWYMWDYQNNFRSLVNFPSQGTGGSAMRYSDVLCHKRGLYIPFTLHDALYMECEAGDTAAIDTLMETMKEGFIKCFPGKEKEAALIRVDPHVWGYGLPTPQIIKKANGKLDLIEGSITTPKGIKVKAAEYFIDERAINEYDKFNQYFYKKDSGV